MNSLEKLPIGWILINFNQSMSLISTVDKKIKQKDYLPLGKLPVIDQGKELIGGYTEKIENKINCNLPVIIFGDHTKVKKYINFEFVPGADGIKVIKPANFYNPKLFYYFLFCIDIPNKGYARHFQYLKNTNIPLLPVREQDRIVTKLEELFSELDAGIQTLEGIRAKLKSYRQSVLKTAFEGKLTTTNSGRGSVDRWKWVTLRGVCNKIQDGSHFSPKKQYSEKSNDRFLYITAKNIRMNHIDLTNISYVDKNFHDSIFTRCDPEFGDVLLTKDGANTGDVTINTLTEPFSLLSSICLLKPNKRLLLAPFLKYYIQSPIGRKKILREMTGTAIKRIILQRIKNSLILLPTVEVQRLTVQEIESRLSVADKIEQIVDKNIKKAETLRQSILKRAFEGRLVPQDPNDEPAEKLLERIKAEKENLSRFLKRESEHHDQ